MPPASVDRPVVLIPAQNEASNIAHVVEGFRRLEREGTPLVGEVVVVDSRSTDHTEEVARRAGATVVREPHGGYGRACLAGLAHLARRPGGPPSIVVFADGNGSAEPTELFRLIEPIEAGQADFVLGSRKRLAAPGSVTFQQRFGNGLACWMIRWLHGTRYSDLAPFRAIRWDALQGLEMRDPTYGWSIEMQVKASRKGLRIHEIDVRTYPRMSGRSKVSGTLRGSIGAGVKIITTVLRYR